MNSDAFDDLVAANKRYARTAPTGFDGIAHEGVLMLTCMDSRIEPLEMIGLRVGEAKILRTPGGRLTPDALAGVVMGVHRLHVTRILVVPHTKCAAATMREDELADAVSRASGVDASSFHFGADPRQLERLAEDVASLRSHPLVGPFAEVGGFMYDVDTGLIERKY